ncbi:MAG: dihydrolipoamide acetyltransferase family protein [Verrucomicrobia bacterium]|nr:dihydrolipoamide acetyltransferase family protein [Verrucomicrobiota bacterium]
MKTVAVKMPQMGQSAAEGTIVKWHKEMGDEVKVDEVLVEVESDKINVEVESPATGRLSGCIKVGRTVPVGEVIAMIETEDNGTAAKPKPAAASERPHMDTRDDQVLVSTASMPASIDVSDRSDSAGDWLSPSVMRLALQNNVSVTELRLLDATGKNGRVTRKDVLRLIARRTDSDSGATRKAQMLNEEDELVPMSAIRRTIADHMVQSIHTSAHVTMVHAVDMTRIVELRNRIKDAFLKDHGVRMSFTSVFTFVTARVLADFPTLNASVMGTNIILRRPINIGCAVALPDESLVVPVVKNANQKSFIEVSKDLDRLIRLSRNRSLTRDDITSGTFTISNFGSFGSLIGTPLINQPQVAILGIGAVFKAPVVIDDEICIRDTTYLSLSFDHRVIDGAMGGRFLNALQRMVESLDEEALGVAALI